MKRRFHILTIATLTVAAAPAASANELILAGICMPLTSRFTKCDGGKVAQCVRTRSVTCRTKTRCTPALESCDLPAIIGR